MFKVFLVAGGTGGHIFPAISLTENYKEFDYSFILDKRTENIVKKRNLKFFKIHSSSIRVNLKFPIYIIKIALGVFQSLLILQKHKPDLVVGFGGYTSIPAILAAKLLKIKVLLHEQNAIMGKTNRLLSLLTKNVAVTFKKTKFSKNNAVHTGLPIREINPAKKKIGKYKKIFVVGGSQGAHVLSIITPKIISYFKTESKKKLIIVQQARKEDIQKLENQYRTMKIKFLVEDFFDDIYSEYYDSDLIISRCGSSTLAEIEHFKKFSILFPLPTSMDNHQYHNALEFSKINKCIIVNEKEIDIKRLSRKIEKRIFLEGNSYKLNKVNNQHKVSLIDLIKRILKND